MERLDHELRAIISAETYMYTLRYYLSIFVSFFFLLSKSMKMKLDVLGFIRSTKKMHVVPKRKKEKKSKKN